MAPKKNTQPTRCPRCNRGRGGRSTDFIYWWKADAWACRCGAVLLCETPGAESNMSGLSPHPTTHIEGVYPKAVWKQKEEEV